MPLFAKRSSYYGKYRRAPFRRRKATGRKFRKRNFAAAKKYSRYHSRRRKHYGPRSSSAVFRRFVRTSTISYDPRSGAEGWVTYTLPSHFPGFGQHCELYQECRLLKIVVKVSPLFNSFHPSALPYEQQYDYNKGVNLLLGAQLPMWTAVDQNCDWTATPPYQPPPLTLIKTHPRSRMHSTGRPFSFKFTPAVWDNQSGLHQTEYYNRKWLQLRDMNKKNYLVYKSNLKLYGWGYFIPTLFAETDKIDKIPLSKNGLIFTAILYTHWRKPVVDDWKLQAGLGPGVFPDYSEDHESCAQDGRFLDPQDEYESTVGSGALKFYVSKSADPDQCSDTSLVDQYSLLSLRVEQERRRDLLSQAQQDDNDQQHS